VREGRGGKRKGERQGRNGKGKVRIPNRKSWLCLVGLLADIHMYDY
jgi:hypothetical protein